MPIGKLKNDARDDEAKERSEQIHLPLGGYFDERFQCIGGVLSFARRFEFKEWMSIFHAFDQTFGLVDGKNLNILTRSTNESFIRLVLLRREQLRRRHFPL